MRTIVLIACAILLAAPCPRLLGGEQPNEDKKTQEIADCEARIKKLRVAFESASDKRQKDELLDRIKQAESVLQSVKLKHSADAPKPPKADAPKTIEEKLKRKVTFEFVDTPFQDAVAFIRDLAGITIVIDPKVFGCAPAPISLRVTDMQLDLALEWICRLASIKATTTDNVLYLAPSGQQVPEWMAAFDKQLAAPAEEWQTEIAKKLSRRVTFDFNEASFEDAIAFLNQLTKVNIILDPKSVAEGVQKTPIMLRMSDAPLSSALKWMCLVAGTQCDMRNQALFVTSYSAPKEAPKTPAAAAGPAQPARVHAKLPNGVELELEGAAAFESTLVRDVIEQSVDSARDGMLIYDLKIDLAGITLDDLKAVLAKTSPSVKLETLDKHALLLLSSDNVAELRRAAVVVRKLRAPKAEPAAEKREAHAPPVKTVTPQPVIKPLQKSAPTEKPKGEF